MQKAEPAAPGEALAVTQGKFKGKPKGPWNPKKVKDKEGNVMDFPCHIHSTVSAPNPAVPRETTQGERKGVRQE